MQDNSNAPAFPVHGGGMLNGYPDDPRNGFIGGGITKREFFAAHALSGLAVHVDIRASTLAHGAALMARELADLTLDALEQSPRPAPQPKPLPDAGQAADDALEAALTALRRHDAPSQQEKAARDEAIENVRDALKTVRDHLSLPF